MSESLIKHLERLVACPSITPSDAGCLDYITDALQSLGFRCQRLDKNNVSNLYAEKGHMGKRLVFAGHTDVVEPGNLGDWDTPPFQLTQKQDLLFGRGVADMKGAVAAMLELARNWAERDHSSSTGILGFLLTSGEEGDDFLDGTPYVMQKLNEQNIQIDYAIVGEPSAEHYTGDTIKIGRRGSLSGKALICGVQGHVAYPQFAHNAIHKALPFLVALSQKQWDDGHEHFPATTLQLTRIHIPNAAGNVIPGQLEFEFNIRYNPRHQSERIKQAIQELALDFGLELDCQWRLSGEPFLSSQGQLIHTVQGCIEHINDGMAALSTSGGTSDARFIAPYGIEVIELGLPNGSIHQVNEHIRIDDFIKLHRLYKNITNALLT